MILICITWQIPLLCHGLNLLVPTANTPLLAYVLFNTHNNVETIDSNKIWIWILSQEKRSIQWQTFLFTLYQYKYRVHEINKLKSWYFWKTEFYWCMVKFIIRINTSTKQTMSYVADVVLIIASRQEDISSILPVSVQLLWQEINDINAITSKWHQDDSQSSSI